MSRKMVPHRRRRWALKSLANLCRPAVTSSALRPKSDARGARRCSQKRTFLRPDQQRRLSTKRPASHCGDARRNLGDTHATVSFTRLSNQVAGFAWDRPRERNGSLSHEVVGTTRVMAGIWGNGKEYEPPVVESCRTRGSDRLPVGISLISGGTCSLRKCFAPGNTRLLVLAPLFGACPGRGFSGRLQAQALSRPSRAAGPNCPKRVPKG